MVPCCTNAGANTYRRGLRQEETVWDDGHYYPLSDHYGSGIPAKAALRSTRIRRTYRALPAERPVTQSAKTFKRLFKAITEYQYRLPNVCTTRKTRRECLSFHIK